MDWLVLAMTIVVIACAVTTTALVFLMIQPPPPPLPLADNFQTYVINMRKNNDRMKHFDMQYNRSDLAGVPYTRIEAVNGYELDPDVVKQHVSPKVWLGLNELIKNKTRLGEGQLTHGMIGCYLSHYSIYEEMVRDGLEYAIIFEDDAKIHPQIYRRLVKSIVEEEGRFPADWDVILLGHWCKMCEAKNLELGRARYFWGLHGYMVSQRGAQKLLQYREPEITMQIDHYMSYLSQKNLLNVWAIHPSYVMPENFGTDLQMLVTKKI